MTDQSDVTFEYNRSQAIADGVLIDVSGRAEEYGFRLPVALTARVWKECVAVAPDVTWTSEDHRLAILLTELLEEIRNAEEPAEEYTTFAIGVQENPLMMFLIFLKCRTLPDDAGNPCLTVMLHDEDDPSGEA